MSEWQQQQGAGAYGTLPVKLIAARWGEEVTASPKTGPSAGRNWTTLGGRPASRRALYTA